MKRGVVDVSKYVKARSCFHILGGKRALPVPSMAKNVLKPTTTLTSLPDFEYSIHSVPRTHKDEVEAIFPKADISDMLIVPTCQKSGVDLVEWGDDAAKEKDRLLIQFRDIAKPVCELLISQVYWADWIDPCSGLPMIHKEGNAVYGEVQGLVTLLGYKTQNAGCCSVLLHPVWGSSVYPASFFAKAPLKALEDAIAEVDGRVRVQ